MFSRIEQALLDRGHARKVFHFQNALKNIEFFYRLKPFQLNWIGRILELEVEAMSLMQAEVADTEPVHLLEKRKKIVGNLTNEEQEILENAQSQLSTYDEKWWSNTRDFYQHSFHRPKGCYIRQLDLFRN